MAKRLPKHPSHCDLCKLPWNRCKGHGRATLDLDSPEFKAVYEAEVKRQQELRAQLDTVFSKHDMETQTGRDNALLDLMKGLTP